MKRFKVYMNRMTTESFIIDAPNIGEAVERAREMMEEGECGGIEEEKIEDALSYEEITSEDE